MYFDRKAQRFCWLKGTSLECAESIYVKTMETACVSDELCYLLKKKKKKLKKIDKINDDSCIECVRSHFAILSMLTVTVRVVVLEYSQLHCEFGGFENVLHDVGVRSIPTYRLPML